MSRYDEWVALNMARLSVKESKTLPERLRASMAFCSEAAAFVDSNWDWVDEMIAREQRSRIHLHD